MSLIGQLVSKFTRIRIPMGSTVSRAQITRQGTEIAEYLTPDGNFFRSVSYGSGNKAAKNLGLRGYNHNFKTGQRTIGFQATDVRDDWGLPLRTSYTAKPKDLTMPLASLVGHQWAGATPAEIVKKAKKLFTYLENTK